MQNMLINLNTISKIKAYNKIYIDNEDFISIENENIFQGVLRFFYNVSRTKNIKNLNNFYIRVFDHISILITKITQNDYYKQDNVNDNTNKIFNDYIDDKNNLIKIKHYLLASVTGLNNLKLTYSSDTLTGSKIDIIINLIETYNDKIDNVIQHI